MIVYFANRKMEIVGQASTSLPKGYTIIEDTKIEEIETGVSSFECKIEFDNKSRLEIEEITNAGNYILRSNGDENEFYTIIETEIDTKEQYIYVYAEDAGLDLLNEIVGEYEATESHTAEWYINKYINDSGFEIGINEIPSTIVRKLKWDGEATCTERLASIANQFGGYEISYSYQINNMVITNKYVNIYKIRGKDVGVQLRLNRDIDRIITKKSVANLATAFKCTGGTPENSNTPITLKGYSYDDGDFYVGTDGVLRSRNACEKWSRYVWNKEPNQISGYKGNIVRLYSYDTTDQSTLCAHAITELKKICDMEVNYEVEINKLPDNVKIGDRVNIVDDEGKLYLSTRILQLETSVTEQTQKATLGDYLIKNDGISQKVVELAEQLAQRVEAEKKVAEDIIIVKATADTANTNASDALSKVESASSTAENANIIANEAKTIAEETKVLTNELIANSVTTEYLSANYAKINLANIENGCITNAMIGTEAVDTSQIADGSITDAKIVELTANKINAGTLDVERLIVTQNNQKYLFHVNEDGTTEYQKLNGNILEDRSITADKIVANAITANEIATATITANEIAANTITSAEIKSGSIKAVDIDVANLFAQDITATGTISGLTLKGAEFDLENDISFIRDGVEKGKIQMHHDLTTEKYNLYILGRNDVKIHSYSNLELLSVEQTSNGTMSSSISFSGSNISIVGSANFSQSIYENGTALSSKYASKSHTAHSSVTSNAGVYADTNMRIGNNGVTSTEYALATYWKDGSVHNLASRGTDGLTAHFGWPGNSSYKSICNLRGQSIRCNGSTTWSSDENLKKDFNTFDEKYDVLFDNLKPVTYKYVLGTSDRYHVGFKTQDVEKALEIANLTTKDFAGVVIQPINSRETEADENDNIVDIELSESNYLLDKGINEQHNLAYIEFIALNTWQIQKLKTKVKEQQNEIEILKQRLENVEQKVGGNSAS